MSDKINKLIDEIVEELIQKEVNLENALLKTQVLAFKLKNEKLKTWVNNELNGYSSTSEIPNYRHVPIQVKGHLYQGFGFGNSQQIKDTVLPIELLSDEDRELLRYHKFGARISQLQELSSSKNGLISELPYSFLLAMTQKIPDWEVIKAWRVIPPSSMTGIISTIKSKLLNFLLELNDELGNENIPIMDKEKKINKILQKNIGEINASNVNITIGDKNIQSVSSGDKNKIQISTKGDSVQGIEWENIRELFALVKSNFEQMNLETEVKEDVIFEIQRVDNQINKAKPSLKVIDQSLKVIYDVLAGVTGNIYTEKVMNLITQIGNSFG